MLDTSVILNYYTDSRRLIKTRSRVDPELTLLRFLYILDMMGKFLKKAIAFS